MNRIARSGRVARADSQNFISRPEAFSDPLWAQVFGPGFLTALDAQGPNPLTGTSTASTFTESVDASSLSHTILFTVTGLIVGRSYCYSAYMKQSGRTDVSLFASSMVLPNGSTPLQVFFNLSAGTFTSQSNGLMLSAPSGWWRCGVFGLATSTSMQVRVAASLGGNGQYQGDGRLALLGYGAQLNVGNQPTPFLPDQSSTLNVGAVLRMPQSGRVAMAGRV